MTNQRDSQRELVDRLLGGLRTSQADIDRLKALESSGKADQLVRAQVALDKKQALRGLGKLDGLDRAKVNPAAFRLIDDAERAAASAIQKARIGPSLIAGLLADGEIACECLVPFKFNGLHVYGSMSGPSLTDVRNGILGAIRLADDEYTVSNPGNTTGTTRVPLAGQMHLEFSATLPTGGRYCLLMPTGQLWVRGHTRVVGHGNYSTCYDAKVWVHQFLVLVVGNTLLEMSGGEIHYDGTRSEDRTKFLYRDVMMDPRYVFFSANAGDLLTLTLRLEVDTEANEDGIAIGVVDMFGFPANMKDDYDTFAIRTS